MIVDPDDTMVILSALVAHRTLVYRQLDHLLDGNQDRNAALIDGCRERIAHIDRIAAKMREEEPDTPIEPGEHSEILAALETHNTGEEE